MRGNDLAERNTDIAATRSPNNTDYSVRARIKRSTGLDGGHAAHQRLQPNPRIFRHRPFRYGDAGHHDYQEFIADFFPPQAPLAPGFDAARLRGRRARRRAANRFLSTTSNISRRMPRRILRWCARRPPKSRKATTASRGIMSIAENNGQGIRAAFKLRNNLYFVKERRCT